MTSQLKSWNVVAAWFGLLLTLPGCGSSGPPAVQGVVSIKGTKLNQGIITFHGKHQSRSAAIRPDGKYVMADVPEGSVVVTIENEAIVAVPKAPPGYKVPAKIPIPEGVVPGNTVASRPIAIDPRFKDKRHGRHEVIQPGDQDLNLDFQ